MSPATLVLFAPSAAVSPAAGLRLAAKRLGAAGFEVTVDADALTRHRGLAGTDEQRLAALHRVAAAAPGVAMATVGGYGLTRLLDGIRWPALARSVERGTRWVGHGDFTTLQLALLAHAGAGSWAGPMACTDFGRSDAEGGVDEVTRDCFAEALDGSLEAVGFRTAPGFDGLQARGLLWGGDLAAVLSLLGTRHWPTKAVRGGVLFLEDADADPCRIERGLLQLRQAGVLQAQRAVLLGWPGGSRTRPRRPGGLTFETALSRVREGLKTPLLTGLPAGASQPRLSLPLGRRVQVVVQGRDVLIGW
ncbi:MAG: LD-carboxypeptidase [Rubrivivax sp.]